ncbi:hypothetical protein HQ520_06205 [bacterium]|nr:hypothetical protein [bacterium]
MVTPLTVVRDVVDAPVVGITNVFEFFADNSRPAKRPHAGVGWSWKGGVNFGIGYDLSFFLFKGLSYTLGVVDYLPCRSVWPNYPRGVSPWRAEGQSWGSLFFPNTRVLWGDTRPLYHPSRLDPSSTTRAVPAAVE